MSLQESHVARRVFFIQSRFSWDLERSLRSHFDNILTYQSSEVFDRTQIATKQIWERERYVRDWILCLWFCSFVIENFLAAWFLNRSERVKHKYKTLSSIEHLYDPVSLCFYLSPDTLMDMAARPNWETQLVLRWKRISWTLVTKEGRN